MTSCFNSKFYTNNPMTDPSVKWKRGDYCIAKYKDNRYYRARIIEVPEGKMKTYTTFFCMFSSSN